MRRSRTPPARRVGEPITVRGRIDRVSAAPKVIGFDLSLTCVGICLPDGATEHVKGQPPKFGSLYDRAADMRDQLRPWLLPYVDLVVIEALAPNRFADAVPLAYVHCMVDGLLAGRRVLKVAPATVKKFATGKGNADKHAMTVAAMRAGWDSDNSTNDEVDAWWLWALGRHLLDAPVVADTAYRRDVIDKLKEATP